ncbi:MAG: DNA alkylation repair protein [Clostridia bacterium]|nr:DNA alkylation repair protein [Clostridia bacterium]
MQGYPLDALVGRLHALADENYRIFNDALTPGIEGSSIGVRMPALRKIAKEIMKDDPSAFLDASLTSPIHEIRLLHAMILAKEDTPDTKKTDRLRAFVPTIDNWAVCDLLCNDLKPSDSLSDALLPLLEEYARSDREFEVRFALVMLMLWFRDKAHIGRTFAVYSAFRHEGYYAKMGAAWGLSYLYIDYPAETVALLKSGTLDCFTHNKAIQKMIESYRISADDKACLRALRRKK